MVSVAEELAEKWSLSFEEVASLKGKKQETHLRYMIQLKLLPEYCSVSIVL